METDRPAAADAEIVVRTFLIADVRGYTRFTQAHGDEEAGKLAASFAALVREALTSTRGDLIELRGDEALCAFHSARQALRAAIELQFLFRQRVDGHPAFPLGIGIGLAAGEAVPVEGGYRGGALNLAARLCSLAAPGQILASETVTSLAGTFEGARFVERRAIRMKGLEKPVRPIEVVPEVELPPVPQALTPSKRQRRAPLIAGGVVLVAVLTGTVLAVVRSSDDTQAVGSAIAAIGGERPVSYTEVGTTPSTIAVGEGGVWVLNADDRTISKIDPETKRVRTFGTGGTPTDLAVGEGAVWVGNGAETGRGFGIVYTASVSRLDPESTAPSETAVLPGRLSPGADSSGDHRLPGVSQIAAGAGGVWAINPDLSVSRIDAETGKIVARIPVRAGGAIAAGREGVWVLGAAGTEVIEIDRRTNKVGRTIELPAAELWGLAVGAGSVWTTDLETGVLWRAEPGPDPVPRPIDVGFGITSVSYGGGAVWVTNFVNDEVVRVDARTNKVTARIPLAGTPPSVAADGETAWVSVAGVPSGDVLPVSACGPVEGAENPDVLITSDLPLQGPIGRITRVAADAIRFVLQRERFRAGPHTVGYQSCDDSTAQTGGTDFLKCASNAKAYAATKRVVGVIGPFTSPCAWAQIPIANRAPGPLAMISPSNTHPGLTHRAPGDSEGDEPGIYYPTGVRNYVRVTGAADIDGAAAAVLADELGLRRVYVLRSTDGIGDETTTPFRRAASRLGIEIAGSATWNPGAAGYKSLTARVAAARPDGVFIGDGLFANGGGVVKALRARLGAEMVLIAGDSFQPIEELLAAAGPAAIGMYVTTTAVAHEGLSDAGRRFVRDFGRTQPGGIAPSAIYVTEAAQAAEALLAAIARSDGTRASVTEELRGLQVTDGILGSFGFDRNGDIAPASFTVFRVTGGRKRAQELPEGLSGAVVDRVVRVPPALGQP